MILRLSRPRTQLAASLCSARLGPCAASGLLCQRARAPRRHYVAHDEPAEPKAGTETPAPADAQQDKKAQGSQFYFEAGYALFAKRPSRPFPPPFLSRPSNSFSDPLSTHNRSVDKRHGENEKERVNGEMIRGVTNGDDAVLVSQRLIAANDGVGAWAQKDRGHAALWSRLILHFWAVEAEKADFGGAGEPDPREYLQRAYELTKEATAPPNEWFGTTTSSGALIGTMDAAEAAKLVKSSETKADAGAKSDAEASSDAVDATTDGLKGPQPVLWITQLGDSQILVVRPRDSSVIFKTDEQWHWFDCPRQLGTNSPDTPRDNAVLSRIAVQENDVVLAMSDGVVDNLWQHEIVENVVGSIGRAERQLAPGASSDEYADGMKYVATELVKAASVIAKDPFAESPFMERAVEEGVPSEGGVYLRLRG